MNSLEFALTLNTNGSNSLDVWASDTGRQPAVQIQESELMQVASLCYTVEPSLAGSGHIFPDDAFELQLFELELNIWQQAHFLANNYQGFVRKQWVMSKEDLAARFKSANAKLLALQSTKATFHSFSGRVSCIQCSNCQQLSSHAAKIALMLVCCLQSPFLPGSTGVQCVLPGIILSSIGLAIF